MPLKFEWNLIKKYHYMTLQVYVGIWVLSPPRLATPLPGRKKKEIKLKVKHKVS